MSSLLQSRWAPQKSTAEPEAKVDTQVQDPAVERGIPASTLSAVANEFSPAPAVEAPASVPHNEAPALAAPTSSSFEFAQTGTQEDDLFGDGITYESMQTRSQDDLFGDDFTPAAVEEIEIQTMSHVEQESVPSGRQQPRTDVRGRGRGRGGARNAQRDVGGEMRAGQPQAPENAPTGPKKETQAAVRGDRQATGGVKKPKLSEAELSEKMAQISIKNASLIAAHARAEADAASFEQREAQAKIVATQRSEAAKARAKEERRDRQQMIGEREKNRMRKLNAMNGREWDAEKKEDDFARGGRFDKKGGFSGDQEDYTDGREYLLKEPRVSGGRPSRPAPQTAVPTKDDFPSLPSQAAISDRQSSNEAVKSWADQVESSV